MPVGRIARVFVYNTMDIRENRNSFVHEYAV